MSDERDRLGARRPALEARAAVRRAVRAYFESQGFLEVETPARVRAPGQEVHLDAFPAGDDRWLITSPEYHMKRLCGGGFARIFQLGRVWRAGERGPHHQSEFTLLEWYRAGEPLEAVAADCERLLAAAAAAAAAVGGGRPPVALDPPFERTTVRQAFARHAGLELRGDEGIEELRARAAAAGVQTRPGAAWDDVFFQVFLDRVEPHLGRPRPTFVFDWPLPLGALARRKTDDPRLCERFELYAGGLELANAFGELTDPAEQRARFVNEADLRLARGKAVYPIDEALLDALGRMPPTAGAALGFDRLVMLVLGAADIRDVVAFPDEEV